MSELRAGERPKVRVLVVVAFLIVVVFLPLAGSDSVTETGQLPSTLANSISVWVNKDWPSVGCDQGCAYIFGGKNASGTSDDILQFNPTTGQMREMSTHLPSPRTETSAVWTGRYVYIFGGSGPFSPTDREHPGPVQNQILRYDPLNDDIHLMDTKVPPMASTTAIWTGDAAYIFGGSGFVWPPSCSVYKYDPSSGVVTPVDVYDEEACRYDSKAVLTGGLGYVFGGTTTTFSPSFCAHEFNPETERTSVGGCFGVPRTAHTLVSNGTLNCILGGWSGAWNDTWSPEDPLCWNPSTGATYFPDTSLPGPRCQATAVWAPGEEKAYIFGGTNCGNLMGGTLRYSSSILAFNLTGSGSTI